MPLFFVNLQVNSFLGAKPNNFFHLGSNASLFPLQVRACDTHLSKYINCKQWRIQTFANFSAENVRFLNSLSFLVMNEIGF